METRGISFSGITLNFTGCAQVRFLLACQPCIAYLLPVNGFRGSNMLNCSLSLSFFNWVAMYSFIAAVFFPTVVTYLYGHYRQGEQKAENKRMSSDNPYAFCYLFSLYRKTDAISTLYTISISRSLPVCFGCPPTIIRSISS